MLRREGSFRASAPVPIVMPIVLDEETRAPFRTNSMTMPVLPSLNYAGPFATSPRVPVSARTAALSSPLARASSCLRPASVFNLESPTRCARFVVTERSPLSPRSSGGALGGAAWSSSAGVGRSPRSPRSPAPGPAAGEAVARLEPLRMRTSGRRGSGLCGPLADSDGDEPDDAAPSPVRHRPRAATRVLLREEWDGDVFVLQDVTCGRALSLLGVELLGAGACGLDLPRSALGSFFAEIECSYGQNPYHNSVHAADVLLSTRNFIVNFGLESKVTGLDLVALYLAAAVHDYAHPGTTNGFENNVKSALMLRFGDSPLERHHLAKTFEVFSEPRFNVLSSLGAAERSAVREAIVEMVLQTDLRVHAQFVSRLAETRSRQEEDGSSPLLHAEVSLVCSTAIKFADIGHVLKPFEQHTQWTLRIQEEFYLVGDRERELQLPISFLCDRERDTNLAAQQLGYIHFICLPFYEAVAQLVESAQQPLARLRENERSWRGIADGKAPPLKPSTPQRKLLRRWTAPKLLLLETPRELQDIFHFAAQSPRAAPIGRRRSVPKLAVYAQHRSCPSGTTLHERQRSTVRHPPLNAQFDSIAVSPLLSSRRLPHFARPRDKS